LECGSEVVTASAADSSADFEAVTASSADSSADSEVVTASAADDLPMFINCKFGHCKLHAWPKQDVHAEVRFQQLHVSGLPVRKAISIAAVRHE